MAEPRKRSRKRASGKTRDRSPVVDQVEDSANDKVEEPELYEGNTETIVSTGSTLLDLQISGERIRGGGIPGGILIEIYGKPGMGKTVMLCEIAGSVQRKKGEVQFKDPEARLNKQFASRFDMEPDLIDYSTPDTIPEMFESIRNWKPKDFGPHIINGIFSDSLAALSTELELESESGDKMGMRRAKEFSQETRKTCRILKRRNYIMVCSNQVRATGNSFGKSEDATGGNAIPFYASLRIHLRGRSKLERDIEYGTGIYDKKKNEKTNTIKTKYGISMEAYIEKSSVAMDGVSAPIYILPQYGIDDIRANLVWLKQMTKNTAYFAGGRGLEEAIDIVERKELVLDLREAVIDLWEKIFKLSVEKERSRPSKLRW